MKPFFKPEDFFKQEGLTSEPVIQLQIEAAKAANAKLERESSIKNMVKALKCIAAPTTDTSKNMVEFHRDIARNALSDVETGEE